MQSVNSLKEYIWSQIKERGGYEEYLSKKDLRKIQSKKTSASDKIKILKDAIDGFDECFDGAINHDIGYIEGYEKALFEVINHFKYLDESLQVFKSDKNKHLYTPLKMVELLFPLIK